MSEINKVINLDSNDKLEDISEKFKSSNSFENYKIDEVLVNILKELKEVTKQLKKING